MLLCVGLFLMWLSFSPFRDCRKMMRFFTDSGIYHEAAADFISSQSFMNDRMRMGNKYIFGKRQCTILRYYDICKVSQVSYGTEAGERSRNLKAVDTSGDAWYFCALKPNTNNQPELKEAIDFMTSKNSGIMIDS